MERASHSDAEVLLSACAPPSVAPAAPDALVVAPPAPTPLVAATGVAELTQPSSETAKTWTQREGSVRPDLAPAAPASASPRSSSPLAAARARVAELEALLRELETRSQQQALVIAGLDAQLRASAEESERALATAESEWDAAWTSSAKAKRCKQEAWVVATQARMDAKDEEWRAVVAAVRKDARSAVDASQHEMRALREHLRLAVSRLQSDVSNVAAIAVGAASTGGGGAPRSHEYHVHERDTYRDGDSASGSR